MRDMKRLFRIGAWVAPSLTHIEARKVITGERVDAAVVLVRDGCCFTNNTFDNCVFICQNKELAEVFINSCIPEYRVFVGGMTDALEYLAFAQRAAEA